MIPDLPEYPPLKKPELRESAFSKPGTMGKGHGAPMKFRALQVSRRGRPRKRKRDPRYVQYY